MPIAHLQHFRVPARRYHMSKALRVNVFQSIRVPTPLYSTIQDMLYSTHNTQHTCARAHTHRQTHTHKHKHTHTHTHILQSLFASLFANHKHQQLQTTEVGPPSVGDALADNNMYGASALTFCTTSRDNNGAENATSRLKLIHYT